MSRFNINFDSKAKFHFVGIGGVSMSGLAIALHELGFHVEGSDASQGGKYSAIVESKGIKVHYGHAASNLNKDVTHVIQTSTVPANNPEIIKAQELHIPILERWQLIDQLAQQYKTVIGVTGSSGKTTTTSLIWQALNTAGCKTSLFLGTILNECGSSVAIQNDSEICVIEADESDAGFAYMDFDVCVITDIDGDHLEHKEYGGKYEKLIERFVFFIEKVLNNGGTIIYNEECKTLKDIVEMVFANIGKGKIASYGIDAGNLHITNFQHSENGSVYDVTGVMPLKGVSLPMIGRFNAMNSLPGIIIAKELGCNVDNNAFKRFQGVDKRLTFIGTHNNITVIDDYAHSPKKIRTLIKGFKEYARSIDSDFIIFCEPHKYTRLQQMYSEYITCFDDADCVIMLDIFGIVGGESREITKEKLCDDIKKHWKTQHLDTKQIFSLQSNNSIFEKDFIASISRRERKRFFVFIGAGLSSKLSRDFLDAMINNV